MSDYVTIPREPTTAMTEAVHKAIDDAQKAGWYGLSPIEIYRTYLAAVPALSAPAPSQGIGREEIARAIRENVDEWANGSITGSLKAADAILALLEPR